MFTFQIRPTSLNYMLSIGTSFFFLFFSGDFEEGGKKRAMSDDRIKTKYRQTWKPINKCSKKKQSS